MKFEPWQKSQGRLKWTGWEGEVKTSMQIKNKSSSRKGSLNCCDSLGYSEFHAALEQPFLKSRSLPSVSYDVLLLSCWNENHRSHQPDRWSDRRAQPGVSHLFLVHLTVIFVTVWGFIKVTLRRKSRRLPKHNWFIVHIYYSTARDSHESNIYATWWTFGPWQASLACCLAAILERWYMVMHLCRKF